MLALCMSTNQGLMFQFYILYYAALMVWFGLDGDKTWSRSILKCTVFVTETRPLKCPICWSVTVLSCLAAVAPGCPALTLPPPDEEVSSCTCNLSTELWMWCIKRVKVTLFQHFIVAAESWADTWLYIAKCSPPQLTRWSGKVNVVFPSCRI